MIPCTQHGPSNWCYEQRDGSHIDSERCRCFRTPSRDCPVDSHRESAASVGARQSSTSRTINTKPKELNND